MPLSTFIPGIIPLSVSIVTIFLSSSTVFWKNVSSCKTIPLIYFSKPGAENNIFLYIFLKLSVFSTLINLNLLPKADTLSSAARIPLPDWVNCFIVSFNSSL